MAAGKCVPISGDPLAGEQLLDFGVLRQPVRPARELPPNVTRNGAHDLPDSAGAVLRALGEQARYEARYGFPAPGGVALPSLARGTVRRRVPGPVAVAVAVSGPLPGVARELEAVGFGPEPFFVLPSTHALPPFSAPAFSRCQSSACFSASPGSCSFTVSEMLSL